jgi:2-succinyl-6-hydroxy-2,4-cyclohexadiene-1-carboxylate synthase
MSDWQEIQRGDAANPAVLLLHGFLGESADWMEVADGLCTDFYCLCPDLPGHGRTHAAGSIFTMAYAAETLMLRLDALKIARCSVAGYSMGGRLALYLAVHHPDRFQRVMLESASPGLQNGEERMQRQQHDEALADRLESMPEAEFSQFVSEWYEQPMFATLKQDPGRFYQLIARRRHNRPKSLSAALRGMGVGVQSSLWENLPDYRVPTLLITGEADHKFRQVAEKMCEACPAMALHVMAGCGHNVHYENPSGYTMLLRSFLASNPSHDR